MKGLADYLCEECRRMERAIARDYRKKEEHELQEFIEQTRREIAKTEEWLRQEEKAEAFDFRIELEEIATTMGLTVAQTATLILVAGLQRRCPCGVGPVHLSRYTGEEHTSNAWKEHLSDLYRLGLLSIAKCTDKRNVYYKINEQ